MNKTYTESFQVRATDCDFERRMRLDALFIAMQEGGERHALSLGAGYDQMMARGLFFALALLLPSLPCLYLAGQHAAGRRRRAMGDAGYETAPHRQPAEGRSRLSG